MTMLVTDESIPHSPEGGYAGIEIGRAHFSGAEVPVARFTEAAYAAAADGGRLLLHEDRTYEIVKAEDVAEHAHELHTSHFAAARDAGAAAWGAAWDAGAAAWAAWAAGDAPPDFAALARQAVTEASR